MRYVRGSLAIAFALVLATAATRGAADEWRGTLIMPKSASVAIVAENGTPVSMYDIAWPATVTRTRGRFLWVQDDGGYSPSRTGGWIYTDDAVKLEDARDHFSSELRDRETAWLYWMRGICWESTGELGIALVDYQNALRVEPQTRIDDIDIRAGRLIAEEQLLGGRGYYNPGQRNTWEHYFLAAQSINGSRPQLFYDWGYALSQACECTQARARQKANRVKAQPAKSPSTTAPANARAPQRPLIASRGIEGDEDSASDHPAPTRRAKSEAVEPPEQKPAETLPPVNPQPSANLANGTSEPPVVAVGPNPEGAQAAIDALAKYETAETLSANWWRLPLARAELMLDQCDEESSRGDRVVIADFKPEFLTQLLNHHKTWKNRKSNPTAAPTNLVASRGGDETDESADNSASQQSAPAVSKPPAVDVIATAIDDFNRAISLNPNAIDAYRDRAEALRVGNRMIEAEQSATTACTLCNFREARSLRTLAQICNDTGRFQQAAEYALRAAELTGGEEQQRFLHLWNMYGKRTTGETAALAVASEKAGFVASRGGDEEDANAPPKHIEPPPGFISREGAGTP